jgi:hypothetical protein
VRRFSAVAGGCLCGAVRYRVSVVPSSVSICHCVTCRRAAGAPAVAWAVVPIDGFAFTDGDPVRHASSPGVERRHCAVCGTSLTYQDGPLSIDVTVASLDDPGCLPPDREIWLDHRLPWAAVDGSRRACGGAG